MHRRRGARRRPPPRSRAMPRRLARHNAWGLPRTTRLCRASHFIILGTCPISHAMNGCDAGECHVPGMSISTWLPAPSCRLRAHLEPRGDGVAVLHRRTRGPPRCGFERFGRTTSRRSARRVRMSWRRVVKAVAGVTGLLADEHEPARGSRSRVAGRSLARGRCGSVAMGRSRGRGEGRRGSAMPPYHRGTGFRRPSRGRVAVRTFARRSSCPWTMPPAPETEGRARSTQ